jgi:hypothetical protein
MQISERLRRSEVPARTIRVAGGAGSCRVRRPDSPRRIGLPVLIERYRRTGHPLRENRHQPGGDPYYRLLRP